MSKIAIAVRLVAKHRNLLFFLPNNIIPYLDGESQIFLVSAAVIKFEFCQILIYNKNVDIRGRGRNSILLKRRGSNVLAI